MKKSVALLSRVLLVASFVFSAIGYADDRFPDNPDVELTPGETCQTPAYQRYPEQIDYCERDVASELKRDIIREYDRELGFRIQSMNRMDFKIDHLIPLCAGGSNNRKNLWPQHKSVYMITDPLEPAICEQMAMGNLKQVEAIELVLKAKHNLDEAPAIIAYVRALGGGGRQEQDRRGEYEQDRDQDNRQDNRKGKNRKGKNQKGHQQQQQR